MKQPYKTNELKCLSCGNVVQAPTEDRKIATCGCRNRAWIQKRPDGPFWAYGSLDPMKHERIKIPHEKDQS